MMRVLVTGGAGGIGLAIARRFHAEGHRVLIGDVDQDGIDKALAAHPGMAGARCDVSQVAEIDGLFESVSAHLGGLDVLVNNVGIGGPTAPAEELPSADWRAVMDINLTGTFEVTQRAIPLLKASAGTIITLSSAAGRYGYPNRIAYATSKWGLIGFTKTLAMELGPFDVTANAILPGAVGGERFDRVIAGRATVSGRSVAEETALGLASQSLKRIVPPEHVADLALFLTTPAGRSISGAALPIDCDLQHG
ncbi:MULTISPECIES: SDR family oxidoreductase [Sphingobium]|uniref:SDR family oxidoreductase n=1 Tax=Sphingobium TaxID=165695 RepID=UPI0015EBC55B|nr:MULTISPECIES: SDR family oxidoreductase [Sphingobium]MCW2362628.1 NAD(P)-dependent dehydrogenase (short-subunit alcohol dehydrogenase family) [Sphingobium sp. B10D3B]MCW2400692.1 NAD(P)-dependent dehydrogenase (short-subunit alcohol dehydrogenase family) [Sphingobium sp. B10D7B]MCW2407671.1 NAD(P)-dependent dehydrogenase (short-subunit alcohol dehydrogenase family) [Sphingobium xanthum]